MAKGRIFEYAIVHHPRARKVKEGEEEDRPRSEIIVDVKRIIAKDQEEVLIIASREIPENYMDKLDQVEIAVRPF